MKKLMIAAAIVCAAAFAEAASFSWQATQVGYDATGAKYTGTPSDGSMVLVLLNNGDSADWSAFETATVVSEASTYTYQAAGTPFPPESFKVSGTMMDDSKLAVKNWYAVLFQDKAGNLHRLNAYGTETALDTAVQVTSWNGGAADPVTLSSGSDKFNFATSAWQVAPSDVPEPTSAMLLLLGVAGLALKRKRA